MKVTTNSIITVSPSTWVPTLDTSTLPDLRTTSNDGVRLAPRRRDGLARRRRPRGRPDPLDDAAHDGRTNDAPTAAMPISAPLLGSRLPKRGSPRRTRAGMSGMSQALLEERARRRQPFIEIDLVEVDVRRLR